MHICLVLLSPTLGLGQTWDQEDILTVTRTIPGNPGVSEMVEVCNPTTYCEQHAGMYAVSRSLCTYAFAEGRMFAQQERFSYPAQKEVKRRVFARAREVALAYQTTSADFSLIFSSGANCQMNINRAGLAAGKAWMDAEAENTAPAQYGAQTPTKPNRSRNNKPCPDFQEMTELEKNLSHTGAGAETRTNILRSNLPTPFCDDLAGGGDSFEACRKGFLSGYAKARACNYQSFNDGFAIVESDDLIHSRDRFFNYNHITDDVPELSNIYFAAYKTGFACRIPYNQEIGILNPVRE